MKRMKRTLAALLLAAVTALTSGCWDMVEINDRLCVRGVGLDAGEQEGMLRVTFQMLAPYASGDTQGKPAYQTLTVEASSVSEAAAHLSANVEQQVHFEHLSAIVLGSRLAQQSPLEVLDYFHRTSQVRRNAEVAAVNGEAEALMTASVSGGGVGEYVENLIKSHETQNAMAVQPSALSRLFVYRANNEAFYLPVLDYQPPESETGQDASGGSGAQGEDSLVGGSAGSGSAGGSGGAAGQPSDAQHLKLAGGYLYDGERFAGVLTADQLALLRLMQGRQEPITLTLPGTASLPSRMSFRVERVDASVDCRVEGDHFVFPVTLEAECVFQEVWGETAEDTEQLYREMEDALAQDIAEQVQSLIDHTRQTGADVLGFEKRVRQTRYAWYQEHGGDWPDFLASAKIPVTVRVTLRRSGYLQ